MPHVEAVAELRGGHHEWVKHDRGRPTFAEIVAEVEVQPKAAAELPHGPGYTADGRIFGPDGRMYEGDEDIDRDRADQLLAEGAVVLIDDCGCRGGCAVEWVTDRSDLRARKAPKIPVRKNKHVDARISEWHADDGKALVLYEGPKFRWPSA